MRSPALLAASDLHVAHPDNRKVVEGLVPRHEGDWLIVAGDVAERADDVLWGLATLSRRFAKVIWVPGNHELWTHPSDELQLRGEDRYRHLVEACRRLGVVTPEDEFPVWEGAGGPAVVAPLFVLYDYTFRTPTAHTVAEALAQAYKAGIVCVDEHILHPDPYPSRQAWCAARVAESERRLAAVDPELPTVLVNHWPLVRHPTDVLHYPEFAQWCGTTRTADWHRRFRATAVVYGHLHIPRTTYEDGVRFEEVSLGYPREWHRPRHPFRVPHQVLPATGPARPWLPA
jgi:3',5'-cyclic AMP phosphodiesterase CpdA